MLNQLADDWQQQHDAIAELIALQIVLGENFKGIIVTVLASLQTRIASFTLSNVLTEDGRWLETGKSLFELEREALQRKRAPPT